DNEVNEKAKELNLYGCVFVLDECHNFFKDKKDEILVWWLTYHRHLYQDIYLITQDLTLVNNEYKRIAEKFYKAADSAKRLFSKKFRYEVFASFRLYKKDRLEVINIPYLDEVFNLYHSGQTSNKKSFVRFYFLLAIFVLIFLLIYFYFVVMSIFKPDTPAENNLSNQDKTSLSNSQKNSISDFPDIFKDTSKNNITCVNSSCHFDDDYHLYPLSLISYISSMHTPLYFYYEPKSHELVKYYYVFDKPVFQNLISKNNKGVSDEKFNQVPSSSAAVFK
ncbi:MAG: zonular occludens toxin domain-containing protein, partial [Campylobacter concisus]